MKRPGGGYLTRKVTGVRGIPYRIKDTHKYSLSQKICQKYTLSIVSREL